ncbi:2-hydroxyacid dehydrogenase [Alteromonas halophila]|uniref:Lactate dehydrogenase n=1 Tax=Alteromonas halophila TaxID=516698 RepID=A0A918JLE8_9ALTE|nr:2-hydroxyacid dehydrogenase [Alteromonas halophila]GGW88234.1 lactate dehydrogenase [Alteromonas halophila]
MKVGVFSCKPYDKAMLESANSDGHLSYTFIEEPLTPLTAIACHDFDAVCIFVNDKVCGETVRALADAGVSHIALRCAGYNNVDVDEAKKLGLRVSRVPAYSPHTVAEHALALILTLNRKTHKAYNRVKEGNFDIQGLQGFTLHGKTVGIVGTGRIGQAVARILSGFGCTLLCYDPMPAQSVKALGASYTDLQTLLSTSHIITLHCPLNEGSYHLINEETIAQMRDGVMLINTSRGGLVNTQAVIKGLKSKKIGYLGLDVYEMESELFFRDHSLEIIQDDEFERLASFHNVLITGHQGFFTQEAMQEIAAVTVANIRMPGENNDNFLAP